MAYCMLYRRVRSSDVDRMKCLTLVDSGVTLARSSMLTVLRQQSYGDRSGLFWLVTRRWAKIVTTRNLWYWVTHGSQEAWLDSAQRSLIPGSNEKLCQLIKQQQLAASKRNEKTAKRQKWKLTACMRSERTFQHRGNNISQMSWANCVL